MHLLRTGGGTDPRPVNLSATIVGFEEQEHVSVVADKVLNALTPLLGRHTARRALVMVCKRAHKDVQTLSSEDLPVAYRTLRPMLRTLIGKEVTVRVLSDLGAPTAGDSIA